MAAIRTVYHGRTFRSKLEADWARAFDALGVTWHYEHEGAYAGNSHLADWLTSPIHPWPVIGRVA